MFLLILLLLLFNFFAIFRLVLHAFNHHLDYTLLALPDKLKGLLCLFKFVPVCDQPLDIDLAARDEVDSRGVAARCVPD